MIVSRIIYFLTRPLMIPVSVGALGVWYGSYDLSYYISSVCKSLVVPTTKLKGKTSLLHYTVSLSSGIVFLGVRYRSMTVHTVNMDYSSASKSFESFRKAIPLRYVFISLMLSGTITGSMQGLLE